MKLNKHDAQTEMEMNMTPMIDVVFLLIIFFMIITDLTQQDLEEIKLPVAQTCVPDEPQKGVVRPIVNINDKGLMVVKRNEVYNPESNDTRQLEGYLADQARFMPKKGLNEDLPIGPGNPGVPDNPLLIRADENTPFKYVQKIMEICGKQGIQIWKIEIAAAESEKKGGEE
ncbi:MAG: biopolymer transporter ExbD [Planctomycetota bacterium]